MHTIRNRNAARRVGGGSAARATLPRAIVKKYQAVTPSTIRPGN
jgi:hypothetical protein